MGIELASWVTDDITATLAAEAEQINSGLSQCEIVGLSIPTANFAVYYIYSHRWDRDYVLHVERNSDYLQEQAIREISKVIEAVEQIGPGYGQNEFTTADAAERYLQSLH